MDTLKQKYYYALVKKGTTKLILIDGNLPIFWSKVAANNRMRNFSDVEMIRISSEALQKVLLV